jgi:energy-converting hydrogenase Eha subunit E
MVTTAVRFVSLLLTALLVGTMFGVWLGFNPAALSASAYVEMQQNAIRALNVSLPALGFVCIFLTVALAIFTKDDNTARYLLIAAALCLAMAGIITRFANPANQCDCHHMEPSGSCRQLGRAARHMVALARPSHCGSSRRFGSCFACSTSLPASRLIERAA